MSTLSRIACFRSHRREDTKGEACYTFQKRQKIYPEGLPNDVLTKVAVLTRVDEELFKVALGQFMNEIAGLESDLALGRRVLCGPALENVEEKLFYVGVSVTDMNHIEFS